MGDMMAIMMIMTFVLGTCGVCACIVLMKICSRLSDISERLRDLKTMSIDMNLNEAVFGRVGDILQKVADTVLKPRKKTSEKAKKAGK